jgi:hypothetical protein
MKPPARARKGNMNTFSTVLSICVSKLFDIENQYAYGEISSESLEPKIRALLNEYNLTDLEKQDLLYLCSTPEIEHILIDLI